MKTTLTKIRKTLAEAQFNPKKPGALSVVLDSGNSEYFIMRAIELLKEAQTVHSCVARKKMIQAIQLVTLVAAEIPNEGSKACN